MAKRVQVVLPDEVLKALQELADEEGETPADALAKAILTRRVLKKRGGRVLVEQEDGRVSEVKLK